MWYRWPCWNSDTGTGVKPSHLETIRCVDVLHVCHILKGCPAETSCHRRRRENTSNAENVNVVGLPSTDVLPARSRLECSAY